MRKKLVLIGNGMAGVRTVEELLKADPSLYEITIIGKEPYPNYNRIQLSSVLQGDKKIDDIFLNTYEWYSRNGITLHTGEEATLIDRQRKRVLTDKGREIPYDKLIVATGSLPFMLPLPGADKEGVIAFRDIKDCETMMEMARHYRKAVVIGGGLLGLEAARGLLNLKMDVTVVHIFHHLMERQLDETAAIMLQAELEKQGMRFLLSKQTTKILGRKRVTGVMFADGSTEKADLVVMAVGIRPNVEMAKRSGLEVNRGIVVNDYMQTSDPDIYAVGECAEHREIVYGLVAPLYEQGQVLAKHLAGVPTDPYTGSVTFTSLKVSGVDVYSAGEFRDGGNTHAIRIHDEAQGIYKKILVRGNRVVGAVLFGDTSDGQKLFSLIRKRADISAFGKLSLFGGADEAAAGTDWASVPDDEMICGCNGVSKGVIVDAIRNRGCTTVEQIKGCTNASRSCGRCKGQVAEILQYVLGELGESASAVPAKAGMCGCTTLSHDEVRREIRLKGLRSTREVMHVLGWSNPEGCSKCRPALNYYLGMLFPEDYADESDSRFINERVHANIQNDGTFSVVPRMYGGVTSPEQLRKIADVAEKYQVRMVKVTGGQRIDLLGVKKEDLPKIWGELDMPSGFAYGKAIRTVKTCVGSTFCRFGTQDSIQMGIDMERKFERLYTPHKVKMAVSGCPRNCAESGIKDIGVVAIEGGWEIYVGGNGGVELRGAELLVTVKTPEEVLEWSGAFLQYYRENAQYLERTSHWIERVGLKHVQDVLADPETRRELNERLDVALSVTKDPWKERVENPELRKQFEPITIG